MSAYTDARRSDRPWRCGADARARIASVSCMAKHGLSVDATYPAPPQSPLGPRPLPFSTVPLSSSLPRPHKSVRRAHNPSRATMRASPASLGRDKMNAPWIRSRDRATTPLATPCIAHGTTRRCWWLPPRAPFAVGTRRPNASAEQGFGADILQEVCNKFYNSAVAPRSIPCLCLAPPGQRTRARLSVSARRSGDTRRDPPQPHKHAPNAISSASSAPSVHKPAHPMSFHSDPHDTGGQPVCPTL